MRFHCLSANLFIRSPCFTYSLLSFIILPTHFRYSSPEAAGMRLQALHFPLRHHSSDYQTYLPLPYPVCSRCKNQKYWLHSEEHQKCSSFPLLQYCSQFLHQLLPSFHIFYIIFFRSIICEHLKQCNARILMFSCCTDTHIICLHHNCIWISL